MATYISHGFCKRLPYRDSKHHNAKKIKLGISLVLVMLVLEPRCGEKLASGGVMEALWEQVSRIEAYIGETLSDFDTTLSTKWRRLPMNLMFKGAYSRVMTYSLRKILLGSWLMSMLWWKNSKPRHSRLMRKSCWKGLLSKAQWAWLLHTTWVVCIGGKESVMLVGMGHNATNVGHGLRWELGTYKLGYKKDMSQEGVWHTWDCL